MTGTTGHSSLAEALAVVQGKLKTLPKDGNNPAFGGTKFTPLDTVVENVRDLLAENGLSFSSWPTYGPDGKPALRYKLTHVSGEFEEDMMPLLNGKQDPQGMGGGITYARRYALTAVLNIVSDVDDDGNRGSIRPERETPPGVNHLADESVQQILVAIKRANKGAEWVRSQLVAAGAQDVPDGSLTIGTLQRLTSDQAVRLVKACDAAAEEAA